MQDIFDRTRRLIEKSQKVKENGGNIYQQLEARLFDSDSGKYLECPVIYAIRILEKRSDVIDFYHGYFNKVKNDLTKYKLNSENEAKLYVINDISTALNLHFYDNKTHTLWEPILKNRIKN